jgi:hypothetical protein
MFTQIVKVAKESPLQTTLGTILTAVTLVGTLFALDARYAKAADVAQQQMILKQAIEANTSNLRKQMIEDKIFEIDLRKSQNPNQRLSPIDQALRDRYQRQLDDLNARTSRTPLVN